MLTQEKQIACHTFFVHLYLFSLVIKSVWIQSNFYETSRTHLLYLFV